MRRRHDDIVRSEQYGILIMNMQEIITRTVKPLLLTVAAVVTLALVFGSAHADNKKDDWRIKIKSAAVTSGPRVTLGEIAEFYGNLPPKTVRDLSAVELWNAAPKGRRALTVSRDKLKKVLYHYLGELVSKCIIPSQIRIQTGGRILSEVEIRSKVVNFLTPNLAAFDGQTELDKFMLPDYIFFSDPTDRLLVELNGKLEPGRNNIRLNVVSIDGRVVRRISSSFFLNLWRAVPCPVRPINRLEEITPDLLTWKRKNIAYLGSEVWDGKGGPWRVKSPIGTGQPIKKSSIELSPVVARGDNVSLEYRGVNIRLSVPAEVLEDGGIGETVTVRNLQSKVKILARVINASTVRVR